MLRDAILTWARTLVGTYYRCVLVGEPGAGPGPVVSVSNHTNGLVDGVVLIRASRRPLKFLAKQDLMRMPVLGWVAAGTGAVPVYRKQDHVPTSWNDGVFDAIHKALAEGEAIGVFPEGTSHLDAGIRPLKTGAARIALGAEEESGWTLGARIVPVGIHYEARGVMGSRVLAIVGPAVEVAPHRRAHADAPWDAALELTGQVHEALEAVRVELLEDEAEPLIGVVMDELSEGTLTPADAPLALRRLVDGWRAQRASDAGAAAAQLDRLRTLEATRRSGAVGAALVALRLLGALLWFLPLGIALILRRLLPLPVDKRATTFLLACSVLFPLWLVVLPTWVGGRYGGAIGAAVAFWLLLSGWGAWCASRAQRQRALAGPVAEERARLVEELRSSDRPPGED